MDERNDQPSERAEDKPRGPGPAARAAAEEPAAEESTAEEPTAERRGPGPAARAAAEEGEPARSGPGPAARAATEPTTAREEDAPERDAPEGGGQRVVDAGTSQELVIINYSNDIRFSEAATGGTHPKHPHPSAKPRDEAPPDEAAESSATEPGETVDEPAAKAEETSAPEEPRVTDDGDGGDGGDGGEQKLEIVPEGEPETAPRDDSSSDDAPAPDESLVIVRNMADQFALEEHQALKPSEIPEPAAPKPSAEPADPGMELSLEGNEPTTGAPPFGTTPAPFAKKEKEKAPETESVRDEKFAEAAAEAAAEAERRRELSDVLGVDWDSELDFRSTRPARRPSSTTIPPVAPPAPTRGGRRAAEPAGHPAAFEPALPLEPPPAASRPTALASGIVFLGATVLMALRIEPFHTWYYHFAWYPMLLVVNHLTALRAPRFSIFNGRTAALLTMVAWSVPLWLIFEVFNFRLSNWYYVGVPDVWVARRLGVVFAFATVVPGIFLLEEMLRSRGWFTRLRTPEFNLPPALPSALLALGAIWMVLVLALPRFFFPLVWGVPVLLLEPWLWRSGGPSLLRDLSGGQPGRVLRLLAVGLFCGLFWESANYFAGGKWIYTVPGFDRIKLFEMPLLGFAGFPPFALCCWVMVRALVKVGLLPDPEPTEAPDPEPEPEHDDDDGAWLANADKKKEPVAEPIPALPREVRIAGMVGAVLFTFAVLEFVDRGTVDSFTARPENVPAIPDGVAEYARGHGARDVRGLLGLIEDGKLYMPGQSSQAELRKLEEMCRLILLRGIGTENARRLTAVEIYSVGDLALWKPQELTAALGELDEPGWKPRPHRVNVWVGAARREYARR